MNRRSEKKYNCTLRFDEKYNRYLELVEPKPNYFEPWRCGIHYIFKFPNGYGASIIKDFSSYGEDEDLWELALLKDGHLEYRRLVNDDVLGYLTDEDVNNVLELIFNEKLDGEYEPSIFNKED